MQNLANLLPLVFSPLNQMQMARQPGAAGGGANALGGQPPTMPAPQLLANLFGGMHQMQGRAMSQQNQATASSTTSPADGTGASSEGAATQPTGHRHHHHHHIVQTQMGPMNTRVQIIMPDEQFDLYGYEFETDSKLNISLANLCGICLMDCF